MAPQFIYVMKALRKVIPPSRIILDDIWLSFYPGAKIGVLGPNGAGKSSLLRIMAGVDNEFQGEAWAHKGTRIGFLPQEPVLDPKKDVKGNVDEAVKEQRAKLDRFNEVSMKFAEPMSDDQMNALLEEQGKLQEYIDAANLWELDLEVEIAMDALRVPPADADVTKLSGGEKRRVALCKVLLEEPDMLLLDEPTNHLDAESVAWLERFLADFPRNGRRDHARSILPRQRCQMDSRARPWKGNPVGGESTAAGSSRRRTAWRSRRRRPARARRRLHENSSG